MKKQPFHIGTIIKERLNENGQKVSWLAAKVACSRSNFYRILEKDDINLNLLWRISQVMHYDFFAVISEQFQTIEKQS